MTSRVLHPEPLEVLAEHGRTFHFASHLLGHPYRIRAATLYAFCRYVDDLADKSEDPKIARRELSQLKRDLIIQTNARPSYPQMSALVEQTRMPITPVIALLEGAIRDLETVRISKEAELIDYAYHVAGTVGLMMCSVLDVTDQKALPFAIDLGIAMQLTNIARDVGEDAELGRVYLPADWIGGMKPEQIIDPTQTQIQTLRQATKRMLQLADEYYDSGLRGLYYLPRGARWAILVAAKVYREIGTLITQADYQTWDRRAVVKKGRKLTCAGVAIADHLLRNRFKSHFPRHNPIMHRHLQSKFGANLSKVA
jgi:phytoene synthase